MMQNVLLPAKAPSKEDVLRILQEELPYLRKQYGVVRLALFGSFACGEPGPDSDVDLLVELSHPLGLEFVDLVYYLEEKLCRRVDLATFDALGRSLQQPYRREIAQRIQRTLTDVETATRQPISDRHL